MPRPSKRTYRCPDSHRHDATITCYRTHGCGCDKCVTRNREQGRMERKKVAYGRTTPLVDATPIRNYLWILSGEMSIRAISRATGLTQATVQRIYHGDTKRLHQATANKIMAIEDPALLPSSLIDATGTHRRMQALAVMGWSLAEVSRRAGLEYQWGGRLLRQETVRADTAERIAGVYRELWSTPAPTVTGVQRMQVAKTKQFAARHGWVGPLHWNNIDKDPEPVEIEPEDRLHKGWVLDELDMLREAGESAETAVAALRRNVKSTASLAYRHGRPDLGRWLEEAA